MSGKPGAGTPLSSLFSPPQGQSTSPPGITSHTPVSTGQPTGPPAGLFGQPPKPTEPTTTSVQWQPVTPSPSPKKSAKKLWSGYTSSDDEKFLASMTKSLQVSKPRVYDKTFSEFISEIFYGDPDFKWGPFAPWTRAARKSQYKWQESTMQDMWDGIPSSSSNQAHGISKEFNLTADTKRDSRPAQIDFTAWFGRTHHPRDYNDDFYTVHFTALYEKTASFAQRWFGSNLRFGQYIGPNGSGWAAPLTEQFLQYSRLVAHEDQPRATWADMINEPDQRKWLVVGILSQIMEKKIFNELLFGANKFFQTELERADWLWLHREGYVRKEGRANIAKSAVANGLIPENFWDSVDNLTGRTTLVFRPLLDLMAALRKEDVWRTQAAFWQELHTLLAFAGYLQVCTAVSPSVFHFLSATPGARMDYSLEQQADMPQYRASKVTYERQEKRYQKGLKDLAKGTSTVDVEELKQLAGVDQLPSTQQERNVDRYHRTRGAKVKFAVFPKVTRYRPANIGADLPTDKPATEKDYQGGEGQKISDLTRCIVVYYQGLMYPRAGETDGTPLDHHLAEVAPQRPLLSMLRLLGVRRDWDWKGRWGLQWTTGPRLPRRWARMSADVSDFALWRIVVSFFLAYFVARLIKPDFGDDLVRAVGESPWFNSAIGGIQKIFAPNPDRKSLYERGYVGKN